MRLIALFLLAGCSATHGYTRAAVHADDGYHAQALVAAPLGLLNVETLLDWQSVEFQDLYIGEVHALYPIGGGWSVFVYGRVDDFGETEERVGAGVQWSW